VDFDFTLKENKGLRNIIHGKGWPLVQGVIFFTFLIAVIFAAMPRIMELELILFRFFLLLLTTVNVLIFFRALIKVSIDETNLYVRTWKSEKSYTMKDINQIKITYLSIGLITFTIKSKIKNHYYILYAPSFERERFDLFLTMRDYLHENLPSKVRIAGIGDDHKHGSQV
jgi:hypothetical protein